jgi:hypothetical protein
VITLQIADPSSRQRGRPTDTRPQISDSNIPTGKNLWSQVPQGYSIPRHSVRRKVTSTSTSNKNVPSITHPRNLQQFLLADYSTMFYDGRTILEEMELDGIHGGPIEVPSRSLAAVTEENH